MHPSAWISANLFFSIVYDIQFRSNSFSEVFRKPIDYQYTCLDVGSSDVNGNIKDGLLYSDFKNVNINYTGLDIEYDENVDVTYKPNMTWPFESHIGFDYII
jgi:hypothetical protein